MIILIELSKKKITFCGKQRQFKRVPAKALKDASKGLEAIQEEMAEMVQGLQEDELKAQKKRVEANDLLLNPKATKKDETRANKLLKEAETIEKGLEERAEEINSQVEELNSKLIESYSVIAETLLEPMTASEFIENHDNLDMIKAKNLSIFYDLYMADFAEAKIEQRYKQMIDAEHDQLFQS